ncbi:arylsulfotransferase family protein [Planctomycetota bacterium]
MAGSKKVNKIFLGLPLAGAAFCLIAAWRGYPFLYIISFSLSCYFVLFLCVKYAVWFLLSQRLKNTGRKHPMAFNLIVLGGMILIFMGHQTFDALAGGFSSEDKPEDKAASLDKLRSLGYLGWIPAQNNLDKSGTTQFDAEATCPGINIYCPCSGIETHLMDLSGKLLHTWKLDSYTRRYEKRPEWPVVQMDKNGDLLAISVETMLVRVDWESRLRWKTPLRCHHDFSVANNGDIYVLDREDDIIFRKGLPIPIMNDYITILSSEGKIIRRISVTEVIKDEIPSSAIGRIFRRMLNPRKIVYLIWCKIFQHHIFDKGSVFDVLHLNSVKLMPRNIEKICHKGDLLISVRNLDWVGILDQQGEKVLWSWGPGEIELQHHPTPLENGNILIFDNGYYRGYSRIVEVNPVTKSIVWEYQAQPKEAFYSATRGSCQRLPNGNTLITQTNSGRVFEVTDRGDLVWEFYHPSVRKKAAKRKAIYRLMRITDPENYPSLRRFR